MFLWFEVIWQKVRVLEALEMELLFDRDGDSRSLI